MNTLRQKIQRHRESGRGRRAFWAVGLVGVILTILVVAPGFGGRHDRNGHGRGHDQRSMAELQTLLRESPHWLGRAGIEQEQVQRIAETLAANEEAFGRLRDQSDLVRERLEAALAATEVDASVIEELRQDTQRLASDAIDLTFEVAIEVAGELTAEQRAELAEHWESRS